MPDQRAGDIVPEVGQVWRDTDPRGGPTFRVVGFEFVMSTMTDYTVVVDLDGKRRRRVRTDRLTKKYELVTNG